METTKKTLRASLVPAAIGVDKTRSRHSVYMQIAHGVEPEVSSYLESLWAYGKTMEARAVAYTEAVTGHLFLHTGENQKSGLRGRLTGTPDGINLDCTLEVKSRKPGELAYCVGDKNWEKHMAQVQTVLHVWERDYAIFTCFCLSGESRIWKVYRTDEYQKKLHELIDEFLGFVDGDAPCPVKLKSRPKMPAVECELLDGPHETVDVTPDLVSSLVFEAAKEVDTMQGLDELEEKFLRDYPSYGESIAKGTEQQRQQLEDAA